jgi:hypothetical protein
MLAFDDTSVTIKMIERPTEWLGYSIKVPFCRIIFSCRTTRERSTLVGSSYWQFIEYSLWLMNSWTPMPGSILSEDFWVRSPTTYSVASSSN